MAGNSKAQGGGRRKPPLKLRVGEDATAPIQMQAIRAAASTGAQLPRDEPDDHPCRGMHPGDHNIGYFDSPEFIAHQERARHTFVSTRHPGQEFEEADVPLGTCVDCRKKIPKARMEFFGSSGVPARCVPCQDKYDRRNANRPIGGRRR